MRYKSLSNPFSFRFDITAAGTPEQLSPKLIATTISFTAGTAGVNATIDDSGSGFLVAGFRPGMEVTAAGTVNNNDTFTITEVTAGTLTVELNESVTTEAAGSSFTLTTNGVQVDEGVDIVVKASRTNTGFVNVADSSAKADTDTSPNGGYELVPSETITLSVKNTSTIWVDSTVSGDDLQVIFEV